MATNRNLSAAHTHTQTACDAMTLNRLFNENHSRNLRLLIAKEKNIWERNISRTHIIWMLHTDGMSQVWDTRRLMRLAYFFQCENSYVSTITGRNSMRLLGYFANYHINFCTRDALRWISINDRRYSRFSTVEISHFMRCMPTFRVNVCPFKCLFTCRMV